MAPEIAGYVLEKNYYNMDWLKVLQHKIRLQDDKLFRKRAQWIPLGNLEDLWEQLAELKQTEIIQEWQSPYLSHKWW